MAAGAPAASGRRRPDREVDLAVERLRTELDARRHIEDVRRASERRRAAVRRIERRPAGAKHATARDEHDADLAPAQLPRPSVACAQPSGGAADALPSRALWGDELDVPFGIGLAATADQQVHL